MIGEWNNGTGRRKSSVARVFLKKGSGKITVNGKDIQSYFGRETSIMIAKQPLMLTNHAETFDVMINVHGGGESGCGGYFCARHLYCGQASQLCQGCLGARCSDNPHTQA